MKLNFKTSTVFIGLFLIGLAFRIYCWSHLKSLTWDEGLHSNPGIGLGLFVQHGFQLEYLSQLVDRYPQTLLSSAFYPFGYPCMTFISSVIFGISEFSVRLPSILSSFLIIHAVYLCGKKLFSKEIAVMGAFFATVNPWFIIWGGRALVDVPMTTCMIYALYFSLCAVETDDTKHWLLTGLFCGLAFYMKPPGLVIIPLITLFWVAHWKVSLLKKKQFYIFLTIISIFIVTYLGYGLLGRYVFPDLGWISEARGYNIFRNCFRWFGQVFTHSETGDPSWRSMEGWTYLLKLLPNQVGGQSIIVLILAGTVSLLRNKVTRGNTLLILAYIGMVYCIFTLIDNKDTRYTIPYLPFMCLLAAQGVWAVCSFFEQFIKWDQLRKVLTSLIILFVTFICFGKLSYGYIWATPLSIVDESSQKIMKDAPGEAVVSLRGDNMINTPTLTFYMLKYDTDLNYSVNYRPSKATRYVLGHQLWKIHEGKQKLL